MMEIEFDGNPNERFWPEAVGGKELHYIPALNANEDHIKVLAETARVYMNHWKI